MTIIFSNSTQVHQILNILPLIIFLNKQYLSYNGEQQVP